MNRIVARIRLAAVGGLALTLGACSTAKVTSDVALAPNLRFRPAVIYVGHFDLPDDAIQSESPMARHPLHAWREQSQAHALADDLEQDVAQDLMKKGLAAQRLAPGEPPPTRGWLVRGTILQMDEGNRLRRTVIGFGAGQTNLKVAVAIDNLSAGQPPATLYRMQTGAQSGKSPGAVVTMNPYAAAAKFVLAGHDLKHNVQKTASQIADRVVAHVNEAGQAPPAP
jgi:Domain of unknown function (DUF4410)